MIFLRPPYRVLVTMVGVITVTLVENDDPERLKPLLQGSMMW
jgi:hypothetical protein